MFNWNSLLDEDAIAAVLSEGYARFLQPIREGLIVFLEGLPVAHQQEILARQASLPLTATISQRLALLARSCPVLHKLGQVLARDQRLAPEFRQHLRQLESFPPTATEDTIRVTLTRELGPLEQRGVRLVFPAIAEASVAIVIPFVDAACVGNRRAGCASPSNGVFKMLKPGIEERLELELELLTKVGSYLDQRCLALGIPHLDYEELFAQIREKLQSEVLLNEEQRHLAQAALFYADEPNIHIPALMPYCTSRVTAMERVTGSKVTDHQLVDRLDCRRLAELVIRALLAKPFFSRDKRAMFHCDPHAGNLFLTDENRLAILDWSLVGRLSEGEQTAMVQLLQAAVTLNFQQMVSILNGLAVRKPPDQPALAKVVQARLRSLRQGQFPGFSWLIGLLDDAAYSAKLRLPADLMLLRKSLHTLEGVLAELGAQDFQIDQVLVAEFLKNFAAEWPQRWLSPPNTRDFATHLSNFDLTAMCLNYPAAIAQFWLGQSADLLETRGTTSKLNANVSLEDQARPQGANHHVADC
ncbi:MAG TPA: AarF/UbiB family protein [Pirellulales bacterium]|nr:AarF/UbiB family protein [Pirellulales bacterium]